MASIVSYVQSVTDEKSPNYLPPEKRIALFDSDGTLIGERYPTCTDWWLPVYRFLHDDTVTDQNAEDTAYLKELETAILNNEPLPKSPRSTGKMAAESFEGKSVEEYEAYVREFLKHEVPGFKNMTFTTRFFTPMVELVKYLDEHDFQVFICSGTTG